MSTAYKPLFLPTVLTGPWSSVYAVTVETVAVNLAQSYITDDDGYDAPAQEVIERGVDAWESDEVINDGSIRGFWAGVWARLTVGEQAVIARRAEELIEIDRKVSFGSPESLYERFDGQR